jgi:glycosyltransferase involved in cell wall biosynthesis
LCSEYPPGLHGGIGSFTRLLARSLVERGHRVRVAGTYPNLASPAIENDDGVQVYRMPEPAGRGGWIRGRFLLWKTVNEWARNREIDIVETPDYGASAAFWPSLAVPVVSRLHGTITYFASETNNRAPRCQAILDRRSLSRSDAWCSCSAYTLEQTQRIFHLRKPVNAVIHNFTELSPGRVNLKQRGRKAVFTGSVVLKKGVIPLVRAWKMVHESLPDAELHIYGKDGRTEDGSSMSRYLTSLLDDRSSRSAYFHGHVGREQLTQALGEARVGVFPSYAEAFSLAPLEAMANGCATIYTQRGSGSELIAHGRNGLLINPDEPAELAAALIDLLSNDSLAETLAKAGVERVKTAFSRETIVPLNERFYAGCIDSFQGSRGNAWRMSA